MRAVRARRAVRAALALRPPVPDGTVEVAVYFTDGPENLYQLDQWFEPLRRTFTSDTTSRCSPATGRRRRHCSAPARSRCTTPRTSTASGVPCAGSRCGPCWPSTRTRPTSRRCASPNPAHRVHLPRRVRQGLHVEQPAEGLHRVFIAGTAARERILRKLIGFEVTSSRSGGPRSTSTTRPRIQPLVKHSSCQKKESTRYTNVRSVLMWRRIPMALMTEEFALWGFTGNRSLRFPPDHRATAR